MSQPLLAGHLHKGVHDYLRTLPRVPGVRPALTYDSVRAWATDEVNETWRRTFFRDPSYAGRQFLNMRDTKGNTLKPLYFSGGTWLSAVKREPPALVARMIFFFFFFFFFFKSGPCAPIYYAVLEHNPAGYTTGYKRAALD